MSISNNFNRFISWLGISDTQKVSNKKIVSPHLEGNPETPPDLRKKAISKEAMFEIMDHAKELERKALFTAMHNRYQNLLGESDCKAYVSSKTINSAQLLTINRRHIERILQRLCKTQKASFEDIADKLLLLPAGEEHLKRALKGTPFEGLSSEAFMRLHRELKFIQKERKKFDENYQKLQGTLLVLGKLLNEKPEEIASSSAYNLAILKLLREALSNPAYEMLKCDETNPCVKLLHSICLASYADTEAITAYQYLGEKTLELVDIDEKAPLHQKLQEIYTQGVQGGIAKSNVEVITSRMKNFQSEMGQVVHAVLSNIPIFLHFPRFLQAVFPQEDQRMAYENNPGAFYSELMQSHGLVVEAQTVYTPGPTVGVESSLEYRACLQAMENLQFQPHDPQDRYLFRGWMYTNLQNIVSILENPQSIGLMRLNEEYPFSFCGITIAQDTDLMKGKGDAQLVLDRKNKEEYKAKFIASLVHRDNYLLENRRNHPGGGYYFPIEPTQRAQWEKEVKEIVEEAYQLILDPYSASNPEDSPAVLSAFRDLTHLGIMNHAQKTFVDSLAEKATANFRILESHLCRSGMDRGGQVNAQWFHSAIPSIEKNPKKQEELMVGATFSRAFFSRRRFLIQENLERVLNMAKIVPPQKIQKFIRNRKVNKTTTQGIGLTFYSDLKNAA